MIVVKPATIFDLAEASGAMTRVQWGIARDLAKHGDFHVARLIDGELLALAGFVPMADDTAEAWFNAFPAARRHMLPLVRAVRLTIAKSPYRAIVTVCRSEAGKRLAGAAGFHFQAVHELGEVWAHGRPSVGIVGQTAGAGTAAPQPGAAGAAERGN